MDPPPKERGRWERGLRSTTCHRLVRKGSSEPSAMAAFLATRSPNKRRPHTHSTDACCDFHDNIALGNGSPIVEREEDIDDEDDDFSSPSESEALPRPLPVRAAPFSPRLLGAQLTSSVSSGISQLSSAGHTYASAVARSITTSSTVITTTVRETSSAIRKRMERPFRRSLSSPRVGAPRVVASVSPPSTSPHTPNRWRRLPSAITSTGRSILHNGVALISKGRVATAKRVYAFRDRSAALLRRGLAVYHKQRECVVERVAAGYRTVVLAADVIYDRTVIVLSTGLQRVRVAVARHASALASAVSQKRVSSGEDIQRLLDALSQGMKDRSVQIQSLYVLGKDSLGHTGTSIRSRWISSRRYLADATCKATASLVNRFNAIKCYIVSVPAQAGSTLQRLNAPLVMLSEASIRMLIQLVDRFKEVGVATRHCLVNAGQSITLIGHNCSESIRHGVDGLVAKGATVAHTVTQVCKNCYESIHHGVSYGFTDATAHVSQFGSAISSCSEHVVTGSRDGLQECYQSAVAKAHELSSSGVAVGRSMSVSFQRSLTAFGVWLSMLQLWLWSIWGSIQTTTKSGACRVSSAVIHLFNSIRVFVVTTMLASVGRWQGLRSIYKVVMLSVVLCLAAFLLLYTATQHKQRPHSPVTQPTTDEPAPRSELAILGEKEREIRDLIRRRIDSKVVGRWSAPLAVLGKLSEPVSNLNQLLESSMNRLEETQGYLQLLPEQLQRLDGLQEMGSLVNSSQLSIRLAQQHQLYLSHLIQFRDELAGVADRTELDNKLNHILKSFEQAVESIPELTQPELPRQLLLDLCKNKLSAHIASQISSELESFMAQRVEPGSNQISDRVKHQTTAVVEQLVESVDFSSQFQSLLASSLDLYAAGRVARPDYALRHAGGSVVDSRSSPPFVHSPHPSYSTNVASFLQSILHFAHVHAPDALYSVFKSTGAVLNHADNLIDIANSAGACWGFSGASGYITIILTESILIDGFTLEHISPDVAFDIRSAPKSFRVFGLSHEQEMYGELLGAFEYILPGPSVQTFDVQQDKRPRSSYNIVRLEVDSNYGNPEVTCVYRFRVHGQPLH